MQAGKNTNEGKIGNQVIVASPLMTDLYQITMAYAEWKGKRAEHPCVFEAFFRKEPFKGRYAVFAGLDEVLAFLEDFHF